MKILNDNGPLRIEDHDSSIRVVHKATGTVKKETAYSPGSIASWTAAYSYASGYCDGWTARDGWAARNGQ